MNATDSKRNSKKFSENIVFQGSRFFFMTVLWLFSFEKDLRIAKTKVYERNGITLPALRIFFTITITDDRKFVYLKYIETIENEFDE